jgi:EAL domain-containing protein (putative c-di-GMP-specific phosphodiesterase class I)
MQHGRAWRFEQVAADLPGAIERGQLSVQYQPIVDLAGGTIVAVEALARWSHPRWGMIPPSVFVPIAEQQGLIATIDRRVLWEACEQTRRWQVRARGQQPLSVNVNLSACLLREQTLVEDVRRTLGDSGLDPSRLRLEITESVLMRESARNIRTLHALRQLGVELAIDDFGTG